MKYNQEKVVRFEDWVPHKGADGQFLVKDDTVPGKCRRWLSTISDWFEIVWDFLSQRLRRIGKTLAGNSVDAAWSGKEVLDPQGPFLQKWNKIFVLSCVIAVSIDPLFFYIPVIDDNKKCLDMDKKLEIISSILRSFTDVFYVLHIIFQFHTGFIAPSSRVFGRGVLVEDAKAIAKRYLSSYFWIDILAVLPLPQVAILIIIPKMRGSRSLNTKKLAQVHCVLPVYSKGS